MVPTEQKKEAHTLLATLTANLAGNDALSAALAAGGSEALAPALGRLLYGTQDTNEPELSELDATQKETISAILSLGSLGTTLATTGNTTDAVASGAASSVAVEGNRLISKEETALSFTENAIIFKDALAESIPTLTREDVDNIFEMTQKAMVNGFDEYTLNLLLNTTYRDREEEIRFVVNEAKIFYAEEARNQTYLDRNTQTLRPMMDPNNFNNSLYNPSSNSAIVMGTAGSLIRTGLGLVPNPYIAIPTWLLDTSINYEGNGLDFQNTLAPSRIGNPWAHPELQRAGAGVSIFNTFQSVDNYENSINTLEQNRDISNSRELQNIYNNTTNNQRQNSRPSEDNTISPYNRRLIIVGDQ